MIVAKSGLLTTVQDLGRWGYQSFGVSVAGPMDRFSHRLANLLVGNSTSAAGLEITLLGPDIEFQDDVRCAVTGAEFEIFVDDNRMPLNAAWIVPKSAHLRFGERRRGARAYLAIAGGLDVPQVLGSRATHLATGMGGYRGRHLQAGDRLKIGQASSTQLSRMLQIQSVLSLPSKNIRLRVILGPQDQMFSKEALLTFQSSRYQVSSESNRMGYRLLGPSIASDKADQLLSDATPMGSIQVPASGKPIILMADGQTAGGYPKIATVITADLPLAGQLMPGDWITFDVCDRETAVTALIEQEQKLLSIS
jgi:antagonist of KipI|tara:strand:+ start:2798 stop:3721 length:924 start_codon:yes stop_codon:yes gene_type:complete